jgi:hypothetical protein
VSGPKTIVDQVVAARADVVIQPSGIDVDEDVALIPVDAVGDARSPADVSPTTARISIRVFSEPETRTLPVSPVVNGTPASGFEIDSITVDPSTVLVEGDADPLAALARVDTSPVSVSGLSETQTFETDLALPEGIEAVDAGPIRVTVTFRPVTESRSYSVGLQLVGAEAGLVYTPATTSVLLSVAGNPAALDGLSSGTTLAPAGCDGARARHVRCAGYSGAALRRDARCGQPHGRLGDGQRGARTLTGILRRALTGADPTACPASLAPTASVVSPTST